LCLPRAPHPAATGGGFGFGQFRRDEQGSPKFVAAAHGTLLFVRIRHLTSFLSPFAAERIAKVKCPDHFSEAGSVLPC
jgi:hypothetical protein